MSYEARTRTKIFFRLVFLSLLTGIVALIGWALLGEKKPEIEINETVQQQLLEQIRSATPGQRIEIPAGRFELNTNLLLATDNITLSGRGSTQTRLSFRAMESDKPAIQIDADGISVSGLTILDAPSTAILVSTSEQALLQNIETAAPNASRERPALSYAVIVRRSNNVVIIDNLLRGARDAGLHILDSDNVLVKDNTLTTNTIGLKITSSRSVDVMANNISYNSMGVLLVESPTEASKPARNTRLVRNIITHNNRNNFFSSATVAQQLFTGVGLKIVGTDKVEVANNRFQRNDASNIVVFSNSVDGFPDLIAFDPYAEGIFIVENNISESGMAPGELANWRGVNLNLPYPDIVYDGVISPSKIDSISRDGDIARVCLKDNDSPRIINLDIDGYFEGRSRRIEKMTCKLPRLKPLKLPAKLAAAGGVKGS